jgi:hypothetical protein
MARQRLTRETLASVQELAGAREHVRLAESILGPSATDNEILATAHRLSHLKPEEARAINQSRQTILRQNQRIAAAPDGADDPWDESGPEQPDPTNNQAYTKQIMTTPDHAVLDSLQKRDKHAPTASRAADLSRSTRKKYRLAAGEEEDEIPPDVEDDYEDEMEGVDEDELDDDQLLDEAGEDAEDAQDVLEDEMSDIHEDELEGEDEGEFDLDEDVGDMDDMLDMEDAELEDESELGEPDIFDDVDIDDELENRTGDMPMAPVSDQQRRPASRRQAGRGRRVAPGRQPADRKLRTGGGQGPARMSLDEILDVHDEDIERTASTPLEGDDLEALLGARVDRAGHRVATNKQPERESPAAQQKRAMLENVWDTENDPEMLAARGGRRRQQRQAAAPQQPRRRQAAKRGRPVQQQQYIPDRRRVQQSRGSVNEFDQVFGVDGMPDVSKFFD